MRETSQSARKKWISEYALRFPKRVMIGSMKGLSITRVRKGHGEHFTAFVVEMTWREHRTRVFETLCIRLAQRAQDSRFKRKALLEKWKKVGESRFLKRQANLAMHAQNMKISAERKIKRNKDRKQWEAHQQLFLERKAAREERDAFLAQWKEKYGHLFTNLKRNHKNTRNRRTAIINRTKEPGVSAHITRINTQPARCHWCRKFMPNGGEADHVIPLCKGGRHIIANIVPSCHDCNHLKSGNMPTMENTTLVQPPLLLI